MTLKSTRLFVDAEPRRKAAASWAEGPQDTPADLHPIQLGRLDDGRFRGAAVTFFGEGSADDVVSFRLWLVDQMKVGETPVDDRVFLRLLGTGSFTLGTMTGAAGDPVGASQLYAHTVSFTESTSSTTPKGAGKVILDAVTTAEITAYSPADNTPGMLAIPDCGAGLSIAFEMISDDAAKKGAALVRLYA